MSSVLIVDGANVVGSRPDGWWRDRAGAARRLHGQLATADLSWDLVVLVLEGQARAGVPQGRDAHLHTVHAPRDGDATVVRTADDAIGRGDRVTVITADRELRRRVELLGAQAMSPAWLLDLLDG